MNKKFIISLICLGAALVIVMGLVRPAWQDFQTNRSAIKNLQLKLTSLQDLLNQTTELKKEEAAIREESEKIFLALPEEKDIPALLVQFETLAAEHGLILESIDFSEVSSQARRPIEQPKTTQGIKTLVVNLKVKGPYEAFKQYLAALENNIRATNVRSINFNLGLTETETFNFDLKVEVYYK